MIPVTVTFYGDVGFDRSYMNVIDFETPAQRDAYFNPHIVKIVQNCAYNKPNDPITVICDYSDALEFTYCKFNVGSKTGKGKEIYAWVDDVAVVTDQPTPDGTSFQTVLSVTISVDPWQTFLFNFRLGESFVTREHRDRFIPNDDGTRGWTLPNTSGISNICMRDVIEDVCNLNPIIDFGGASASVAFSSKMNWIIIQYVLGTGDAENLNILFVPVTQRRIRISTGDNPQNIYSLSYADLYDDKYVALLGLNPNSITNVTFVPFDIVNHNIVTETFQQTQITYDKVTLKINMPGWTRGSQGVDNVRFFYFMPSVLNNNGTYPAVVDMDVTLNPTDDIEVPSTDVYSKNHEPQLYKSPYKVISVIDENGIEVGSLPDICANVNNGFSSIKIRLMIDSVSVRVRIIPNLQGIVLTDLYWVEYQLATVDVPYNEWLRYLMEERDAARSMIRSQLNQQAIASAISMVGGSVNMGSQQAMAVGKAQAGGSASAAGLSEAGAFGAGALVGMGVGAIATIGGFYANQHYAFEQQDIRERAVQSKANNVAMPGTFKSLVGSLRIVRVKCDDVTLDIKAKEFHKYGYNIYGYETPNTKTRKYFNYISTSLVKIEGSLNNDVKMAIAQIYNNGVTIWHGDYISELTGIGDYSKENIERRLM